MMLKLGKHVRKVVPVAAAFAGLSCASEADVRAELEKKEGCSIVSIDKNDSGAFEYKLDCEGDRECTGTMKIEKGMGSSSSSSFESCYLKDEACKDSAPDACASLGSRYQTSEPKKARTFYDKACAADAKMCRSIGKEHWDKDDKKTALSFFERGCAKPDTACLQVGHLYVDSDDDDTAEKFYDKACEAGAKSCFDAGLKFDERKIAIANAYYTKGCNAEKGEAGACYNLALNLVKGEGKKDNIAQVRELYLKGCDMDHGSSCNNLGVMLGNGEGGPRDTKGAFERLGKACKLETKLACETLEKNCQKNNKLACDTLAQAKAGAD